jgi:hypothetical protein
MAVIILHSQYEEASRNLIASLGVPIPDGDDVMVDVGGVGVRIISDHAKCVAMQQSFRAYPVLLYILGPDTYVLDTPASWRVCLNFIDNPTADQAPPKRILSQLEFGLLFTEAERIAIRDKSAEDKRLFDIMDLLNRASEVNLDFTLAVRGLEYIAAAGCITGARLESILAGEPPA